MTLDSRIPSNRIPPNSDPIRLAMSIQSLNLPPRALRACRTLGVRTAGDFFGRTRGDFLAVPNCGDRTFDELDRRVRAFVVSDDPDQPAVARDFRQPIRSIIDNPRALRAFFRLGITTIADFLATPRRELLAVRGFGQRTYDDVLERIRTIAPVRSPGILPTCLTDLPVSSLGLSRELVDRLHASRLALLGDLLGLPPDHALMSVPDREAIRAALDALVRIGLRRFCDDHSVELERFREALMEIETALDSEQFRYLETRIGIGEPPRTAWQLTTARSSETTIDEFEATIRARIADGSLPSLVRLRAEMHREMEAFEGVVTGAHLAPGTLAHAAARSGGDAWLALRLAAFCWPDSFHLHREFLSDVPHDALRQLGLELHGILVPESLPMPLHRLEVAVGGVLPPGRRSVLLHLLREHFHLTIRIDSRMGEVVHVSRAPMADQLERIFDEQRTPLHLDDLMFHYRDRHRSCRRSRIADQLRADSRFIELDHDSWSLREWHLDEIEIARVEAERIRDRILADGTRQNVRDLAPDEPLSNRAYHLLLDTLRREPSIRNLGRGDFCPRQGYTSELMTSLTRTLRRAMGELPLSRFLQNQPEARRRVVATLLKHNRAFVAPSPDRIDVLENYPFNAERLHRFLQAVDTCIETRSGHATLAAIRAAIDAVELGGAFLTDHLLLDLLRRHGDYEILPGPIVATAGLAGWIQQRARNVIRECGHAVTPQQVLAEEPDLAEFHACVPQLMDRDPLIHSEDGLHYQIV